VTMTKSPEGLLGTIALASLTEQELIQELGRRTWQRHEADRRTGVTISQVRKVIAASGLPPKLRPVDLANKVYEWAVHDLCNYTKAAVAEIKAAVAAGETERQAYNRLAPSYHRAALTAIFVYLTEGKLPIP
jgi:hypothetical protein